MQPLLPVSIGFSKGFLSEKRGISEPGSADAKYTEYGGSGDRRACLPVINHRNQPSCK